MEEGWNATFRSALWFALFVGTFLLVFAPFGTHGMPLASRALNAGVFALVTAVGIVICAMPLKLFPSWSREEDWNLGKELLWGGVNFLVIALLNYLVMQRLYGSSLEYGIVGVLMATIAVGFFPYAVLLLFNHARMLRSMLRGADHINDRLDHRDTQIKDAQPIEMRGENEGEVLHIQAKDLICVRSAGNYIEVFWMEGESVRSSVLRCSMASAGQQLSERAHFFRSHRTCIMNLQNVRHIDGNAQGYKVQMKGMKEHLPVSRSRVEAFDKAIASS